MWPRYSNKIQSYLSRIGISQLISILIRNQHILVKRNGTGIG